MCLSDRIREKIEASGKSLYRIAKDAGISYPVLHRFYYGKRDIYLASVEKLARVLHLDFATGPDCVVEWQVSSKSRPGRMDVSSLRKAKVLAHILRDTGKYYSVRIFDRDGTKLADFSRRRKK